MTDLVDLTRRDGVAVITLARPQAGNAMNWDMIDRFAAICTEVAADTATRAVLLRGEGRNFCVGGDIRAFRAEADPAAFIGRLARRLHKGLAALADHAAPLVVAARGACAGAGLSLVAAGDVVIAAGGASFSMAYAGIGLTADGGATWLLPRAIGLRRTQELAYIGRRLDAGEAERYGLVTRVVADEALDEQAFAVAARIATGPTQAFGAVKRLLATTNRTAFADQLDAEAAAIEAAMANADAAEGVAAFLDRRRPAFTGG